MKTPQYGLFSWRGDGRYFWSDRFAEYVRESAAQKRADAMNARGEYGGDVVVRSRKYTREDMRRQNPRRQARRKARAFVKNPGRLPRGRAVRETVTVPLTGKIVRAGGFVEQMKYEDADDRKRYVHDFGDLQALLYLVDSVAFGRCILVVSADDKPLWEPA